MVTNADVERIAETHFFLRPVLVRALKEQQLTDDGRKQFQTAAVNYHDLWVESFADRWYDMASMIRLGTAIETGLRDTYTRCAEKPAAASGVFQRLVNDTHLSLCSMPTAGFTLRRMQSGRLCAR